MKKNLLIFSLLSIFFLFSNCKEDETVIEELSVTYEKTDVTTLNGNDGSITLTVTGGKQPIVYQWSNGESTANIENLIAGTYNVTVTDASNQIVTKSVLISQPELMIAADSVIMGAGYANDIYFSLTNGVVKTVSRTQWDIAFYTNPMSSSIITNDGNNVMLYVYPHGNKNNWNDAMDVSDMESWTPLYNTYTDSTWQNGAFDKGAMGHPDYGWGVYDMNTHSVFGDSIHIIQLADKSLKKLFIEKRDAMANAFTIKFADLDGQNEQTATISCKDDLDKNFVHFSIAQNAVVAQEPKSADWDFVFTKYWDESIPYIVTGVLTNDGIGIAEMAQTDTASNDYITADYAYNLMTIGSDWKKFNMSTFSYSVTEDLLFYVKNNKGNYYKIVFTGFASSNGKFEYVLTTY